MSYDTPLSAQGQQMASLPLREQLRRGFRDMGSRSYSSAKNFGKVGAIFAGTECCIESVSSPNQSRLPTGSADVLPSIEPKAISRTV